MGPVDRHSQPDIAENIGGARRNDEETGERSNRALPRQRQLAANLLLVLIVVPPG